jgi:uncharacterized protein YhbP (UPF0306 family)
MISEWANQHMTDRQTGEPTARLTDYPTDRLRDRLAAFLAAHTTVTLATVGVNGTPAAAAVFYAHDADLNLYFLSEERTQHGLNLTANPLVAGTIQSNGEDWRTIKGLQLRGVARLVPGDASHLAGELAHAAAIYCRKFAFVGALLAGAEGPGVLTGPLVSARFWVLRPSWLRLIDNTVRFGFKEEWVRSEQVA